MEHATLRVSLGRRTTLTERFREAMTAAVCAGLVAGLAYASDKLVRTVVFGRILSPARDVAWMAPLASVAFFIALAIPAALVASRLPRDIGRWLIVTGLATLGAISVTFLFPFASHLTLGILSLGVGVTIARGVVRRPEAWFRGMRRASAVLAALVVAMSGAAHVWFSRTPALAVHPRTPAGPNVLVIVLDAVGARAMSLYGYHRLTTPRLDALAREGTVFDAAYSVAPWTLPSHLSMLTGDYALADPARSQFLYRPITSHPRLPAVFRRRGYATIGVVGNLWRMQWDTGLGDGFDVYRDHTRSIRQILHSSLWGQTRAGRDLISSRSLRSAWAAAWSNDFTVPPEQVNPDRDASQITDEFLAWHKERPKRPFFALLNYADAHAPYAPPAAYERRFASQPDARARYDAELAFADEQVHRLLTALRQQETLDNTVTIVTGDHGELFGEHGLYEHSSNLYNALLHVPLIVRYPPRVPAGLRVPDAVSLRDLAATVLDLAGAKAGVATPGVSLAATWQDSMAVTSPVLASVDKAIRRDSALPFAKGSLVALTAPPWRYIRNNGTGHEELFNLAEDPRELRNRASSPDADSTLRRLRDSTDALLRRHGRVPALAATVARR